MTRQKKPITNFLEVFTIPELWWQPLPKYHVSRKGNVFSLKGILYPDTRSVKKYTRKNQLIHRSLQAKIFDSLLNIGYFNPLPVVKEFPIVIQNRNRRPGQRGSFYLADYYFPTALDGRGLVVELDSEYHLEDPDSLRDEYLRETYGIQTFRMAHFEREDVQKRKFPELCALLRSLPTSDKPRALDYGETIRSFVSSKLSGKETSPEVSLISESDMDDELF